MIQIVKMCLQFKVPQDTIMIILMKYSNLTLKYGLINMLWNCRRIFSYKTWKFAALSSHITTIVSLAFFRVKQMGGPHGNTLLFPGMTSIHVVIRGGELASIMQNSITIASSKMLMLSRALLLSHHWELQHTLTSYSRRLWAIKQGKVRHTAKWKLNLR